MRPSGRGKGCPLYVCNCLAVNSRTITRLARRGASSVAEISDATGAGTVCGKCRPTIAALLAEHAAKILPEVPSTMADSDPVRPPTGGRSPHRRRRS